MDENIKNAKAQMKKWICVEVTHRYNKSEHCKTIKEFLKNLFPVNEILFVGNDLGDGNFKNALDGYFFIQCDDAAKYIDVFKNSKYISNILVSYDQISYIDDSEIRTLLETYDEKCKDEVFSYKLGDIVKIKSGMFKNLYAMVVNSTKVNELTVMFKFISGYRFENIKNDNCELKNNFFDYIRVPVL